MRWRDVSGERRSVHELESDRAPRRRFIDPEGKYERIAPCCSMSRMSSLTAMQRSMHRVLDYRANAAQCRRAFLFLRLSRSQSTADKATKRSLAASDSSSLSLKRYFFHVLSPSSPRALLLLRSLKTSLPRRETLLLHGIHDATKTSSITSIPFPEAQQALDKSFG